MAKTLRILSIVFIIVSIAALIYSILPDKQLSSPYIGIPLMLSIACSMLYNGMVKKEQGSKLITKKGLIITVAVYVLVVAVIIAIIVLN